MQRNLEIRRQVGHRIRVRRIEAGLTQEDLASAIGAAQSLVSAWEGGRRMLYIDDAIAIAQALDCKVAHLVGEEPRLAA